MFACKSCPTEAELKVLIMPGKPSFKYLHYFWSFKLLFDRDRVVKVPDLLKTSSRWFNQYLFIFKDPSSTTKYMVLGNTKQLNEIKSQKCAFKKEHLLHSIQYFHQYVELRNVIFVLIYFPPSIKGQRDPSLCDNLFEQKANTLQIPNKQIRLGWIQWVPHTFAKRRPDRHNKNPDVSSAGPSAAQGHGETDADVQRGSAVERATASEACPHVTAP